MLAAYPPSADGLLLQLSTLVSDEMLDAISVLDYGMGSDEHFEALRQIRDFGLRGRLREPPLEVLQLCRWGPPSVNGVVGAEASYLAQMFCCSVLLLAAAAAANRSQAFTYGENEALVALVTGAIYVKPDLCEMAGRFLTWRLLRQEVGQDERPHFAFALLCLAVLGSDRSREPPELDDWVTFVERTDLLSLDPTGVCTPGMFDDSFLARTVHRMRERSWLDLARGLRLACPDSLSLARLLDKVERI